MASAGWAAWSVALDDSTAAACRYLVGGQLSSSVCTVFGDALMTINFGGADEVHDCQVSILAVSHSLEWYLRQSAQIANAFIRACGIQCGDGVLFGDMAHMLLLAWIWTCHGCGAVISSVRRNFSGTYALYSAPWQVRVCVFDFDRLDYSPLAANVCGTSSSL